MEDIRAFDGFAYHGFLDFDTLDAGTKINPGNVINWREDKIEKEDVEIFVEFTENSKINQEIKLEVQLPEGVSLIKVEPEEVNLKINNK